MAKKYDVVAKTGTYTQNGEEKARWLTVGAVIETKNGYALLLERWFNPAGLVDDKNGESVILNLLPADREPKSAPKFESPEVPF